MSDKPISPLRQRMIDDMTARRFKEKVQKDYVRHVRAFAAFLGRSPDSATSEDVRRFQLHMAKQQIDAPTINAAIAALRFFFNVTLERPDLVRPLTTVNEPRRAPSTVSAAGKELRPARLRTRRRRGRGRRALLKTRRSRSGISSPPAAPRPATTGPRLARLAGFLPSRGPSTAVFWRAVGVSREDCAPTGVEPAISSAVGSRLGERRPKH